jgi:hypothetical protein
MTSDDINRMWEHSEDDSEGMSLGYPSQQHYFAALVAAAEREACAKICLSLFDINDDSCSEAEKCAAAIRARGQA